MLANPLLECVYQGLTQIITPVGICVMKGRHNENASPALACISLFLNMNKVLLYSFVFYLPQSSIKDFA